MAQGKELLWAFKSDFPMNFLCTDVLQCFNTARAVSSTVYSCNSKPFSLVKCPESLLSLLCSKRCALIFTFPIRKCVFGVIECRFQDCLRSWRTLCSKGNVWCVLIPLVAVGGWAPFAAFSSNTLCCFLLVCMLEMCFCSFSSSEVSAFQVLQQYVLQVAVLWIF